MRSTTYLVEHYWPGVTVAEFAAAAERVRSSTQEMASEGLAIHYLHSTMVPGDEAAFCVFEAASAELIAEVYARAEVRFERVVDALEMRAPAPAYTGTKPARATLHSRKTKEIET